MRYGTDDIQFRQYTRVRNVEMPSEMSYLLFISSPCQNRRMAERSLPESQELCLEITVLARIAESRECLEIKIASPVNQICRFAATKSTRKPYRGLPQASHGIILNLGVCSQYGVPMPLMSYYYCHCPLFETHRISAKVP